MTDEEKKGIISSVAEEVISKLKNEGTDIAATPTETNDENVGSVLIIGGDKELKQISKSNLFGKRITGRSADSNSLTDPFRFLGNYEGRLQELWVALDGWTGDSTSGNEGFFRARNGNSIIEIASYPLSYKDNYWLQVVKGKLKVTNNGELTSATNYNVVSRVHNYGQVGWSNWELIAGGDLKKEIADLITAEQERATAKEQELTDKFSTLMGGVPDAVLDTIKEISDWLLNDETGTAAIINKIDNNANAIVVEANRAKEKENSLEEIIVKEKTAVVNGDTIAGQAREIYSRTGKTDSATFLERTTAGGTSISDGVASVKQIGGNIVKNLVSGYGTDGWKSIGNTAAISQANGIYTIQDVKGVAYCTISWNGLLDDSFRVDGHTYYYSCKVKAKNIRGNDVVFGISNYVGFIHGYRSTTAKSDEKWQSLSLVIAEKVDKNYYGYILADIRADRTTPLYAKDFLCIDLTEMFGAGKEPTKEECDRMFGTMDALPQGLTIAQPTVLKSTGYNQCNPSNVLKDKTIADNAITDLAGGNIAIVECLPCAVGAGENNGYVIGYGEGDDWSDEGVEVYLTPLNPMEVEGELYMHKLEKDATYGTYVPQIKGYMLVVTPTINKICAHFHWSGDRAKTDYEEYIESNVALPTIPQMSEWGLAGISSSGTLACDTIDLDRMVYTKRIGCVDLGSLKWFKYDDPARFQSGEIRDVVKIPTYYSVANVLTNDLTIMSALSGGTRPLDSKQFMVYTDGSLFVNGVDYSTVEELKTNLQGVMLYYELATPEEYPIVTKAAPNYIGSDYGVEKWLGSQVPLSANILFYMRSLVGETRNFLDQLYTNTQKTDAKEVANYITNGIEDNKQLATNAPNLALRALYVAAGALYNDTGADIIRTAPWGETITHKARHYYLNGLGDITEEQMSIIYASSFPTYISTNLENCFRTQIGGEVKLRTNLRWKVVYPIRNTHNLNACCYTSSTIEVFVVSLYPDLLDKAITVEYAFYNCSNLKAVIGNLIVDSINSATFAGCNKLQEVRLKKLTKKITFVDSPLISKESILYIINNAAPTSAITITLHADAYARLANDADIVAALEAQPLITLVSA